MAFSGFCRSLSRKKTVDLTSTKLNKFMGTFDLTAIGVGSSLGLGVYVLAGQVAKTIAGPSVIVSFAIAAFASVLAGFCFAEFGARVPKAGSAYIYSYVTVGEFVAFLVGWNLVLEYAIGSAALAKGISEHFDILIGGRMSEFWKEVIPMDIPYMGRYVDFSAFAIVVVISIGLALGAKESTMMNNLFASIKILVIIFIIVAGCFKLDFANWTIPPDKVPEGSGTGGFFAFGFTGVVRGAAKCFFGFIGFDIIASAGEEVKNPRRSIPLSICLTLLICFFVYTGISTVLTLMVPYYSLDNDAPFPHVFQSFGWSLAVYIISIGSIIGLLACLIGAIFPLPRIIYAMAEDGLLFDVFARVHERFKTPTLGILIAGFLTGTLSAIFDVDQLVNMISIGTLVAYATVAACVLLLKYEVDHDGIIDDSRIASWPKVWNSVGLKAPTKFTSRLVKVLIFCYIALCIWFTLAVTLMEATIYDNIKEGDPVTIFTVVIPVIAIIIVMTFLARQPKSRLKLPFSVPFTPWFPALSILLNIYLLVQLGETAWIRFSVWMAIGMLIYVFYGRRNSKMNERHLVTEISDDES